MSHNHEGVSCDSCLQNSFRGRRYKCLLCYDFDLCSTCYESGVTKQQHTAEHPMQCILPRADNDLYFGGEHLSNSEQPQSYTCPICCIMGFTYVTLAGHVSKNHGENLLEVICPVCATVPGGDPNRMTEDLARHLTLDHHSAQRDFQLLDDGVAIRVHDARRVPHPVYRGRTRPRRSNMQFTPGPLSSRTSSLREPVDPIAELLSHLSGVRRTASNSGSGAFQQFQMQWQIDRHVHATRQHLERLSHHQTRSLSVERKFPSSVDAPGLASMVNTQSALASQSQPKPTVQSKFLLAGSLDELSLTEAAGINRQNRSEFLQELMISTIAKPKCQPSKLSVVQEEMCNTSPVDVERKHEPQVDVDSESTEKEEGGVDSETNQDQDEKIEKSSSK